MHDPLLPPLPPATRPTPPQRHSRIAAPGQPRRAKHPAMSARILAVGLSTTAMLGLTAGYALAGKDTNEQLIDGSTFDPAQSSAANTPASPAAQDAESVQNAPQPGAQAQNPAQNPPARAQDSQPQTAAPSVTIPPAVSPDVVVIPVEPAKPAQPGGSGGGNSQPSSGSN